MLYVQRDAEGRLIRVEAEPYSQATETLGTHHPEIQGWYASQTAESNRQKLKQSDVEMIRVLDDLVQVLVNQGIIRITDLPAADHAKLLDRSQAREVLGGLSQLIEEEESGLI